MRIPIAAAFTLFFPISLHSEVAKEATIREFLSILHIKETQEQVIEETVTQMFAPTDKRMLASVTPFDQKQKWVAFKSTAKSEMEKDFRWEEIEPELIVAYQKSYSEEDLKAIVSFLKTRPGQVFLENASFLSRELGILLKSRMQKWKKNLQAKWTEVFPYD